MTRPQANGDEAAVAGFGAEWAALDQLRLEGPQYQAYFDSYFGARLAEWAGANPDPLPLERTAAPGDSDC